MTLRDEVDKAVADLSSAELSERLESAGLKVAKRLPEYSDEEWRKRTLDYHFSHNVESKRKKAIERISQAVGVTTPEEHAAELVERQLSSLQPTAWQWFSRKLLVPILVAVIGGLLLYALTRILPGK